MRSILDRAVAAVLLACALLTAAAAAGPVTVCYGDEVMPDACGNERRQRHKPATIRSREAPSWVNNGGGCIRTVDEDVMIVPLYGPLERGGLRSAAKHFLEPPAHCAGGEGEESAAYPTTPAPGALILVAIGLLGIGWMRRRRMILHDAE